jgi:hypothetical protein
MLPMKVAPRRRCWNGWAALGLVTALLWPTRSRAEGGVQACLEAAEDGQKLRDGASYVRARERFILCAGSECPGEVRKSCVGWLGQLDALMPTVVFAAQAGGSEIADVRVVVDGKVVLARVDGKPFPIDPGAHHFRFERAGGEAVDQTTVVRAGEKERLISAHFGPEPSTLAAPTLPSPARDNAWVYALGAAGLVSLAAGAVLDVSGYSFLQACNGDASCTGAHERAEVEWRFVTGDILLGAGVLCGALAWLQRSHETHAASHAPTAFIGVGAPRLGTTVGLALAF